MDTMIYDNLDLRTETNNDNRRSDKSQLHCVAPCGEKIIEGFKVRQRFTETESSDAAISAVLKLLNMSVKVNKPGNKPSRSENAVGRDNC
jgi:hypothetical protein